MPIAEIVDFAGVDQARRGVLADGLGQAITHRGAVCVGADQGLVYQAGHQVEHGVAVDALAGAHLLNRVQRRAAGEDRKSPQQRAFTVAE